MFTKSLLVMSLFLISGFGFSNEVNSISVNPEGQIGFNVEVDEAIPTGVDILMKGRTKSEGSFELPVSSTNPDNPKDGMIYVHTSGEVRFFVGNSWYKLATEALPNPLKVETGVVSCTSDFQTVNLTEGFISPVIVTTPVSNNSNAPVVVRLDNVTGSSFDVKLQRMDGNTDPLGTSLGVHYVVIEEGVYNTAEHGVQLEARKVESTVTDKTSSWVGQPLSYLQSYSAPVVLGQVMTYNNEAFNQFWCRGSSYIHPPSAGILNVGKHTFATSNALAEPETLGVIIIEAGSGTINDKTFHAGVGADTIRGVGDNGNYNYNLPFSIDYGVVSQVAMDGGDGGVATYKEDPQGQSVLKTLIDEDTVVDSERKHTTEQVAFLVFQ